MYSQPRISQYHVGQGILIDINFYIFVFHMLYLFHCITNVHG